MSRYGNPASRQPGLLLFDLDDTLWPARPVLESAEKETMQWLQKHAPKIVERFPPQDMFKRRMQILRENPLPEHKVSQMRLMAYQTLARESGYGEAESESIASRAFEHFLQHRQNVRLFDDVEENLVKLQQRYLLGALSNGNADINNTPLKDLFAFALATEELDLGKPHPMAFEAALHRASEITGQEIPASETVHVGDDLVRDVAGARSAGLQAVWLDRKGDQGAPPGQRGSAGTGKDKSTWEAAEICRNPDAGRYHARITTLDHLHDVLASLQGSNKA